MSGMSWFVNDVLNKNRIDISISTISTSGYILLCYRCMNQSLISIRFECPSGIFHPSFSSTKGKYPGLFVP